MSVIFVFHLIFAIVILIHQATRLRRVGIDSLTFIGFGFALAYGLGPAYFYWVNPDELYFEEGVSISFTSLKYSADMFSWLAFPLYCGAYATVCVAYRWASKGARPWRPVSSGAGLARKYEFYAWACLVVGGLILLSYIMSLGGIQMFFSLSMYLRSDENAIYQFGIERVAFLKNAAMILLSGSILSYIVWRERGLYNLTSVFLFLASLAGSLVLMIHRAGRLDLAALLAGFLIVKYIGKKEIPWLRMAVFSVVFACFAAVGKVLFWRLSHFDQELEIGGFGRVFHSLMGEILFPHFATVTALTYAGGEMQSYRYFVDIPIALVNLVPSALFGVEKLRTVAQINTDLMATGSPIPVDLVGFGYYSLGLPGVLIWAAVFGACAGLVDRRARREPPVVAQTVIAFAGIMFGVRVLYCEPTHIILNSLHVLIVIAVVFLPGSRIQRVAAATRVPSLEGPLRTVGSRSG
jgi:hypothetical protein